VIQKILKHKFQKNKNPCEMLLDLTLYNRDTYFRGTWWFTTFVSHVEFMLP